MECPADQVLAEFLDSALAAPALRQLEIHIDVCSSCRIALSHVYRDRHSAGPDSGAAADIVGAQVGRYLLCDVLGAGGMGVVYAARDPELDRRVAVKVLRDDADAGGEGDDRLRAEAQALARISHPNVLAVYDVGRVGGRRFVAMELVDGATLRDYLAPRALDWRERLRVLVGVGRGLAAAHAVGVVHRDVKPDNVLVGADGRPRVADFGLARAELAAGSPGDDRATSTAAGTPAYLAPELRTGTRATAASDQFAFATMCWELLLGGRPATPPGLPRGARGLRRVSVRLQRALAADPGARWPSMTTLVDALELAARPRRRGIALLAAVVIGGVALVLALRGPRAEPVPAICAATATRAAGLWPEARATAVRLAFARSGSSFATVATTAVDDGLRRAALDWGAVADAACRRDPVAFADGAGPVECLERRHAQAEELATIFATADGVIAEEAAAAVAALRPAADCVEERGSPEPPRPASWLALARRIAAAFADLDLGRHELARTAAEAIARDADAADALALAPTRSSSSPRSNACAAISTTPGDCSVRRSRPPIAPAPIYRGPKGSSSSAV